MGRYVDGKIFLVHTAKAVPIVAFLFATEAKRVNAELEDEGIECFIKEVHCFSNGMQRVFALILKTEDTLPVVAFASLKDANNMSRILCETGSFYIVSEISCFEVMRKPVFAKYRLKFGSFILERGSPANEQDAPH